MARWLLALCLPAAARGAPVPDPLRLDLPAAMAQALAHNLDLARTAYAVQKSQLGIRLAETGFEPQAAPLGAGGLRNGQVDWSAGLRAQQKTRWGTALGASGQVGRNAALSAATEDDWRSTLRVELRQPLLKNFGPLIHNEPVVRAGETCLTEQRRWELQQNDLVVELVRTFENILRLRKEIQSDEGVARRMEKLYTLTRAREQQGRATRVDTLRVELKRGQAQSRLENNRETLYSLTRDFAQLLGVGLETEFDLEAPPLLDIAVTSDTEAVTTALANRLDYAQVLQDYHARHRAARIARRGLYPDVALVISREQGGAGADLGHAFDRDDTDWFAGLAGDFDLNQHANQLTYQQAELDTDSAAQTIRIRVLTITREVLQGLSRYRRAGADLRIEERNLALAQNRSALAQHLYQAGRGDNFSVTDAEDARVQAESKYLKAQAEVVVTGYDLLRCLGTLLESPDELKPAAAGARRDG